MNSPHFFDCESEGIDRKVRFGNERTHMNESGWRVERERDKWTKYLINALYVAARRVVGVVVRVQQLNHRDSVFPRMVTDTKLMLQPYSTE